MLRWTAALRIAIRHSHAAQICKMTNDKQVARVRRDPKDDVFEMRFNVSLPELNSSREFNMKRRVNETLDAFTSRIRANVEKAFGRKLKKSKKKDEKEADGADLEAVRLTAEIQIDGKLASSELTCQDVFFSGKRDLSQVKLVVCGIPLSVEVNLPYVQRLILPQFALAGLPFYPSRFMLKFGKIETSEFNWFVSADEGSTWTNCGSGLIYFVQSSDEGKLLKLDVSPSNGRVTGETTSYVVAQVVKPAPPQRPYQKRHEATTNRAECPDFRVVSYNILADKYAETEAANTSLFPYCPKEARSWAYRRGLIVDELLGYKGDIVCLQEVDSKAFDFDLTTPLKEQFVGVFNSKYTVDEGVATFFNRHRFKLLSNQVTYLGVELNTKDIYQDIWEKVKDNGKLVERVSGLGTVAQAVVLSEISCPEKILVVGNTHLFFHPDADHIRLLQSGLYAKFLVQVAEETKAAHPNSQVALVVCGDFNSVPSCGIFALFTQKIASPDLPDWTSKENEEIHGLQLQQPFEFASAYGAPPFTNFTAEFADCLDYIFYQKDQLTLLKTTPLLSEEELRAHTALPSVVCPSDHMALVADLTWTEP